MEAPRAAPRRYTFRKDARLCARRLIEPLFQHGTAFNTYPLRFVWALAGQSSAGTGVSGEAAVPGRVRVLISVSKRHFRRAHDRNRIKRLLREAWRLRGAPLLQPLVPAAGLSLALLYIGREKPESLAVLTRRLRKGLERLAAELPANRAPSAP